MPRLINFVCKICKSGAERLIYPSTKGTFEYCSVRCRNTGNARKRIAKGERLYLQTCPACGQQGRRKQTYCNKHLDRTEIWDQDKIEYLEKHYSAEGAAVIAQELGLSLTQVRDKANKSGLTLSKEASREIVHSKAREYMTKNNPMFFDGPKEKLRQYWEDHPEERERALEKMAIGRAKVQRDKPTKLEIKLFAILDSWRVEYEPFFLVKPRFIVDCKIGNLIIQADGEYWHGHPRFEPLTDRQKTQQKRDNAQDKYLATCGYSVERIWEHSLDEDAIRIILNKYGIL